jgi:hypothetical protein
MERTASALSLCPYKSLAELDSAQALTKDWNENGDDNDLDMHIHAAHVPYPLLSARRGRGPRVLHCHDMMGGYNKEQGDAAAFGQHRRDPWAIPYVFKHWELIDAFVYFSHACVTMPPAQWTNACHTNGALCLGTLIFEHRESVAGVCVCVCVCVHVCIYIYTSPIHTHTHADIHKLLDNGPAYAHTLARLAACLGFDGWLVNIEYRVCMYARAYRIYVCIDVSTIHR